MSGYHNPYNRRNRHNRYYGGGLLSWLFYWLF